ncbi:MAG: DUF4922 domain-containing protein [Syntrophorhabdaceae bacterium]|nr:DUF4922 domain-containing protein [Syntrophorhabdaceae bacterium]
MKDRILSRFDGTTKGVFLSENLFELLSAQRDIWPELKKGYEMLSSGRIRDLTGNGFSVKIQYNPLRIRSTMAGTEGGIKKEGCFLCPERLPPLQKGILYRDEFLILCNPAPVFPFHFTVSHIDHRPQYILGSIGIFLSLARDAGDSFTVLYNGAKCGASAPEHMHFQIIPSSCLPIERELTEVTFTLVKQEKGVNVYQTKGLSRYAILLEGKAPLILEEVLNNVIGQIKAIQGIEGEPLMNSICLSREGITKILIFPRARHRPSAFFKEGDGRILISPGVLEMAGFFVAPVKRDFERLDIDIVDEIYREVSSVCDIK